MPDGTWRIDHCRPGSTTPEEPIWRDSPGAAERAAWRLEKAGFKHVVWWYDAAVYVA